MAKEPKKIQRKVVHRIDGEKILFDHDFECAVLGAILLEGDAFRAIAEVFKPAVFDHLPNRYIAEAIVALFQKSKPIDLLTVTQEIKEVGLLEQVGGAYYISSTTNRIAAVTNIEFHYRILQQYYLEREILRIGDQAKNKVMSYGSDVFETHDWARKELDSIMDSVGAKTSKTMRKLFEEAMQTAVKTRITGESVGVSTGFRHVDNATGGWHKSNLIIGAGRPGMGKTAFVLKTGYNAAVTNNIPIAIFSLEMSAEQLMHRLISIHSQISSEKFTRGKLSVDEEKWVLDNSQALLKAPIHIDDTPAISLFELRAKAYRLMNEHKIQLIIVDYLQLMSGVGNEGNREQEVSAISKGLKKLSRELDIPVIALSQLSRQTENRVGGNKKPQLSDLRESGSIEQDSDLVFFLFRPEYYGLDEYDFQDRMIDARGFAEFIIAKNRHGETGPVPLSFSGECMDFSDFDTSKLGTPITKQDVKGYLEANGHLDNDKKDSTFVQPPENENKQEVMTNNTNFLNETT